MTEHDQLKKNAEESRVKDQIREVGEYLDTLTLRIEETSKRSRDAMIIYLIAWAAWFIAGFINPVANDILETVWLGCLIYQFYRTMQSNGAYKEFFGAIKILELLGMIPPRGGNRESKKRQMWSEGADIVKGWFTKKKEAQEDVYAPA